MAGDATGGWVATKTSVAAALTDEIVKASPPAGQSHCIEQIVFSNEGTANSFVLEDANNKVYYGPVYLGANQTFNSGRIPYPIVVDAAEDITVTTTAADHSSTIVHGYTRTN